MKEIKDLKLKEISVISWLKRDDFIKELREVEKKLFVLKMKLELNELKQTHLIKFLRRYIARLKTLANVNWFNLG